MSDKLVTVVFVVEFQTSNGSNFFIIFIFSFNCIVSLYWNISCFDGPSPKDAHIVPHSYHASKFPQLENPFRYLLFVLPSCLHKGAAAQVLFRFLAGHLVSQLLIHVFSVSG